MGNSAARKANYSYLASDSPTATSGTICAGMHGGGWNSGDNTGNFLLGANSSVSLIYPVQQQAPCRTALSANYTCYTNAIFPAGCLGTAAAAPAAWSDLGCYLHWIAHEAGTLFPGNAQDIVVFSFSAGTQMSMAIPWGSFATTCEWSDPYTVRLMVLLSPVYDIAGQWNGTYGSGGSGLDSTFATSIEGEFSCTVSPQSSCPTGSASYNARQLWTNNSVRIGMLVDGSTDTITNPTYQGAAMISDMTAKNLPYVLEPGVGHGGTCHTATSVAVTSPCWAAIWLGAADNARSSSAGGSFGAGGTL